MRRARQRWRSLPVRAVLGALWRGRRANDSGGMSPRFACAAGLAGLAILAGCDSDESLDLRPYTIDTRRDGQPTGALVAHETADGWVAAAEASPGVFTFTPTSEDVVYALICPPDANTSFGVEVAYDSLSGPEDDRSFVHPCNRYAPDTDPRQRVTFNVIPADATLGIAGHGASDGGGIAERTLNLKLGARDVVAMTADRVLVQRAAAFDPAVPFVVDVSADGVERVPVDVPLPAGAAGEVVGAAYRFRTAGGGIGVDFTPRPDIRVVPASLVQAGDSHVVDVTARHGRSVRWLATSDADPAQLDLSAGFTPNFEDVDATWDDQFVIRWTGRPAEAGWMMGSIDQFSAPDAGTLHWGVGFHESWLERHDQASDGTWTPPDLSAVAGWNPAWNLDRAQRSSSAWLLGYLDSVAVENGLVVGRGTDWYGDFFEDPSLRTRTPTLRRASTRPVTR